MRRRVYMWDISCDCCGTTLTDPESGSALLFETAGQADAEARGRGWGVDEAGSYALCEPGEARHAARLREWLGE